MSEASELPVPGCLRSVQVPNSGLQLAKIVENRQEDGRWFTLVRWIDIRREAEWLPSSVIPK